MRTLGITVACVLALAAGALAYDRLAQPGGRDDARASHRRPAIALSGHIEGLYPNQPATLKVRAVNRTARPLVLRKVKARALAAGPGCPASMLAIRSARPRTRLGPHRSATVRLRTLLSPASTSACERATWPLRFRARAVARRAR